jgi:hypothetical protein
MKSEKERSSISQQPESLWKTKLTLKALLALAQRDEAQALKDRKPIDYHMFLTSRFDGNSIFQHHDQSGAKFTTNLKPDAVQQINEQDAKENRVHQGNIAAVDTVLFF